MATGFNTKLGSIYSKILDLHSRINPSLQTDFYTSRFRSFSLPSLLVDELQRALDSLLERLFPLVSLCPSAQHFERVHKMVSMLEIQLQKQMRTESEYASTIRQLQSKLDQLQSQLVLNRKKSGANLASYSGSSRNDQNNENIDDSKSRLVQRDLNLISHKLLNSYYRGKQHAYVTKFDFDKITPRTIVKSKYKGHHNKHSANLANNQSACEPGPVTAFTTENQGEQYGDQLIYQSFKTEQSQSRQKPSDKATVAPNTSNTGQFVLRTRRNSNLLSISISKQVSSFNRKKVLNTQ